MCDQDHFAEDLKKYSRRDVGTIAAAVGVAMMLPRAAHAVDVKESEVTITTPDGSCDAYFVAPTAGAHAAVLVWPDIFGLRPAFREMGKRLGRGRLQRARRQSVLSADEGADGTARRGDPDPAARADDAGANGDDARHRREGVRRVARCAPGSRQEQEDRHDGVLHGRADRHAHGGGHTESDRCRRLVPWRRPHHDESGQPAFADPADEGAVPDRRSRERRHARPDLEDDSQGRVRGREAEGRDRGVPGRARLVPARQTVYDKGQAEKAWGRMLAMFKTALA